MISIRGRLTDAFRRSAHTRPRQLKQARRVILVMCSFLATSAIAQPPSEPRPPASSCLFIPDTPPNPDSVAYDTCASRRFTFANFYVKRWFWLDNIRGILRSDIPYTTDSVEYEWKDVVDSTRPELVSALTQLEAYRGRLVFSTSDGDAIVDLRQAAFVRFDNYVHCDSTIQQLRQALAIASDTAWVDYSNRYRALAGANSQTQNLWSRFAQLTINDQVTYVPYFTPDRELRLFDILGRTIGVFLPTDETHVRGYNLQLKPATSGIVFVRIGHAPTVKVQLN